MRRRDVEDRFTLPLTVAPRVIESDRGNQPDLGSTTMPADMNMRRLVAVPCEECKTESPFSMQGRHREELRLALDERGVANESRTREIESVDGERAR